MYQGGKEESRERHEPLKDDQIRNSTVEALRIAECRKEDVRELILEGLRDALVVVEVSLKRITK